MAVLALKQWFSLKFMQSASIISSESFWKIYLHRWINLEFPRSSLKVVRTSTRDNLLVLIIPQSFYLYHFFHNFEFSEQIAESKSINLKSYSNTLVFKLKQVQDGFQNSFLKTFMLTDDISCHRHIKGIYWWSKIP